MRARPADSFNPVTLDTTIAPVLRVGTRVPIKVHVSADPGVLDIRDSLLKVEVALAPECEGTFAQSVRTGAVVLMNRPIYPQPVAGKAYSATASARYGVPKTTGTDTVCVWLVQQSDQRVYASDQSITVTVKKALAKKPKRKPKSKPKAKEER